MATIFAGKGDKDRAISYLYTAYDNGFKDVEKIKAEPSFVSLEGRRAIHPADRNNVALQPGPPI